MNKLFKKGDYVLLSDCKAFDEKYGLEECTAIWAVARKMQDGETSCAYMNRRPSNICVGIYNSNVGLWERLHKKEYSTRLTVEDVLYRSQDGLTLNELSKIAGAFDDGKEYKCVVGTNYIFNENAIYKANGEGIKDEYSFSTDGHTAKFKPVTPKEQWVPKVGDEVLMDLACKKVKVEAVLKHKVCVSNGKELFIHNISLLKPIDKERERVINRAKSVGFGSGIEEYLNNLYNTGMLKEGGK